MFYMIVTCLLFIATMIIAAKLFQFIRRGYWERHCHNCGYPEHPHKSPFDLVTPCSECGLAWPKAARKNNVKKWISWVAFCFAFTTTIVIAIMGFRSVSYHETLPDWLVVRLAPMGDFRQHSDFVEEITRRRSNGELNPRAASLFASRIVNWLDHNNALVRYRALWPRNVQLRIGIADPLHFSVLAPVGIRIVTEDGYVIYEHIVASHKRSRYYSDHTGSIPEYASRSNRLRVWVEMFDPTDGNRIIARKAVDMDIDYALSWPDVCEPVDDDIMSLLYISEIRSHPIRTDETVVIVDINHWHSRAVDYAVGLRVDVFHGNNVLATGEYVYDPVIFGHGNSHEGIRIEFVRDSESPPKYVRVSPDPLIALRDFDKCKCLDGGSITLPIPYRRDKQGQF